MSNVTPIRNNLNMKCLKKKITTQLILMILIKWSIKKLLTNSSVALLVTYSSFIYCVSDRFNARHSLFQNVFKINFDII